MESIQLYLNSKTADKYYQYTTDCEFYFPMIEIPDGFYLYLSVQQATIPYTFYNINSKNNSLSYVVNATNYFTITITEGNYNINQLISFLKLNMSGFNISYNDITGKLSFLNALYNFQFLSTSTCLEILGFNANRNYLSNNFVLISENVINLHPIKCINIESNLLTYNINKAMVNNSSILCCIPILTSPYSLITYSNPNNFKTNLFVNELSKLHIKLIDQEGNIINLNGNQWAITIQLDVIEFK